MKRARKPGTPMLQEALPPTFAEAEEREIISTFEEWYPRIADKLTSEAAHNWMRDDLVRQLQSGETAALPLAYIIAMADAEHPPADHALRIYIHAAMGSKRFQRPARALQAYAQRALLRGPLPISDQGPR